MSKLIFVYNAGSGYLNVALDMAHKIFSPDTYPCSLCDLTYGIFKIRPEWDDFVKNTPLKLEFLHKDEFHKIYPDWSSTPLPLVLADHNGPLISLISSTELNELESVEALKNLVLARLSGLTD